MDAANDVDEPANEGKVRREYRPRNRKINNCIECRRLKRKCSRTQPCTQCLKTSRECVFVEAKGPNIGPSGVNLQRSGSEEHESDGSPRRASTRTRTARQPEACLRVGRICFVEAGDGTLSSNLLAVLEDMIRARPAAYHWVQPDNLSFPIEVQLERPTSLPLATLFYDPTSSPRQTATIEPDLSSEQRHALLEHFFVAVHPLCAVVSREEVEGPSPFTWVLHLAMLYAASISMRADQVEAFFASTKTDLVRKLKTAAEQAFAAVGIVTSFDLLLFQAVTIYLTPQFLAEISRAHSIYISAVIRQFQIAGYDRDSGDDDAETCQTKRHVWQQLLILSSRASETVGPERTAINDLGCRLPDIAVPSEVPVELSSYVVASVRYECYRIQRIVLCAKDDLQEGRSTFAAAWDVLVREERALQDHFLAYMNATNPYHKYAAVVAKLLLSKAEAMLLETQFTTWAVSNDHPHRERTLQACMDVVETAITLDTDSTLTQWAWYAEAYQQYRALTCLLSQIFVERDFPHAARVMAQADHVFGPAPGIPMTARCGEIFKALRDGVESVIDHLGEAVPGHETISQQKVAEAIRAQPGVMEWQGNATEGGLSMRSFDLFGSGDVETRVGSRGAFWV